METVMIVIELSVLFLFACAGLVTAAHMGGITMVLGYKEAEPDDSRELATTCLLGTSTLFAVIFFAASKMIDPRIVFFSLFGIAVAIYMATRNYFCKQKTKTLS